MIVALVVLGPDKLPQAARNIAKFYREVRNFSNSVRTQVEDALELDDSRSPRKPDAPNQSPNPVNPDLSGFTLVDAPVPTPAEPKPEASRGAPLFQPDTQAPEINDDPDASGRPS